MSLALALERPSLGLVAWLLTYLLHSTVLLVAVWLALRFGRPRSLRLREKLLRLGLFGALVTSSFQVALQVEPLLGRLILPEGTARSASDGPSPGSTALALEARRATAVPRNAVRSSPPSGLRPSSDLPSPGPAPVGSGRRTPARDPGRRIEVSRASGAATAAIVPAAPLPRSSSFRAFLEPRVAPVLGGAGTLWAFLAGLVVLGFVGSTLLFERRLRERRQLTEGTARRLLDELELRAGAGRRIRLSASPRLRVPLSFGILRPEICLPERALEELDAPRLRALLAHELAHALRRDPLWFGAMHLVTSMLAFQLGNRLLRRRLLETAEILCDEDAVRWTRDRLALASCLTEVAGWISGGAARGRLAASMTGTRSRLGERIERLLAGDAETGRGPARERTLLVGGGALLATLVWAGPGAAAPGAAAPGNAALGPLPPATRIPGPAARPEPERSLEAEAFDADLLAGVEAAAAAIEVELSLLTTELRRLREALPARGLRPGLAATLEDVEQRTHGLLEKRARIRALLDRLHGPTPNHRFPLPGSPDPNQPR